MSQRKWWFLGVGVLTVLALAAVFIVPKVSAQQSEGSKPYTPTRLEWLALELEVRNSSTKHPGIVTVSYGARPQENTIVLGVSYFRDADHAQVSAIVDVAKMLTNNAIKRHGWESWVKIEVKETMIPWPPLPR